MFEEVNISVPGWGATIEPTLNLIIIGVVAAIVIISVGIQVVIIVAKNQR